MKPNSPSDPILKNARRSKSVSIATSMVKDESLRVENAPQYVLKRLAADAVAATAVLNIHRYLSDLALVGGMHEGRHEEPPRDFRIVERLIREPMIEIAVSSGDL